MKMSLAAITLITAVVSADEAKPAEFALFDDISFSGEIRPRFESADVNDNQKDGANAFTVRTTLGVKAGKLLGQEMLGAYVEATSVNNFGYDNYNSTANGKVKYDTIVDPNQARMTQAYVDVKLPANTLIRAGRQMVNLDNQRFVGAVGWRQMFQTFDAAALVTQPVEGLSVLAAYVYGINTVKVQPNNKATETGSALFNASYSPMVAIKVTGYAYLLASISDTFGGYVSGTIKSDDLSLGYRAEYAVQSDPSLEYRVEDVKADASYMNVDLQLGYAGAFIGANYEMLGKANGNASNGFWTPLATLHKFNGWADVFLGSKNVKGLIDMNGRIGYKAGGIGKLMAVYHKFDAEEGDTKDLGSEIDVLYANKVPGVKGLKGLLKAALYSKGETGSGFEKDKSVFWAQLDYTF